MYRYRPAVTERTRCWGLDAKVVGTNPPTVGRLLYLVALCLAVPPLLKSDVHYCFIDKVSRR